MEFGKAFAKPLDVPAPAIGGCGWEQDFGELLNFVGGQIDGEVAD